MLGMASGFPWVMIGSALSAWLQEGGLERSVIGYFGAVFAVYSINVFWSPLIDRVQLPGLSRWLGQRRSWMFTCQLVIVLCCMALSQLDLIGQLTTVGVLALTLATASSTQDVAIDAFRIESFGEDEPRLQSAGAAMATAGWWTGYSGLGAIPFFLVDGTTWQWQDAYIVLGLIMAVIAFLVLFIPEPKRLDFAFQQEREMHYQEKLAHLSNRSRKVITWLTVTIVEPVAEFFRRNGVKLALSVLLFIFLFKVGEAFLGRMSIVFYKEIGFTNDEIGLYSKLINWWVTIFFAVAGSLVNLRLGIVRGLFIGGLAMASSNLFFSWIALSGPNTNMLLAAVVIDGFTGAWSTVAFVAFISLLCHRSFTATQYALMASLGTLGRTVLAAYSGVVVDWLDGDWALFFLLTALMVLPSLLFLFLIRKQLTELELSYHDKQHDQQRS
nr:MFS transporter [Pseudidiomarina planktonica]